MAGRGQTPSGPDIDAFYAFTDGTILGVPMAVIYLLGLAAILGIVLHHTAFGRHVFALGGNEKAAALTGVAVERVKVCVYGLCSLSAGFASPGCASGGVFQDWPRTRITIARMTT